MKLYEDYKKIKEERASKKWYEYEIEVAKGVKDMLNQFQSIDGNSTKGLKPLRLSKNGKGSKLIQKISNDKKNEQFQNLPDNFNFDDEINNDEAMGLIIDNNN